MHIYLVLKDSYLRFLINPSEEDMAGAEVILNAYGTKNLYQSGFPLIQKANDLIFLEANEQDMLPEKIQTHKRLADVFELDVPGVLMLTWQIARNFAEAEFIKDIPLKPAVL